MGSARGQLTGTVHRCLTSHWDRFLFSRKLLVCFHFSHDVVRGLIEAQEEETTEEGINYVAMRNLFVREAKEAMEVKVEKKTRTMHIRESAERMELTRTVKNSDSDWCGYRTFSNVYVKPSLHSLTADGRVVRVP